MSGYSGTSPPPEIPVPPESAFGCSSSFNPFSLSKDIKKRGTRPAPRFPYGSIFKSQSSRKQLVGLLIQAGQGFRDVVLAFYENRVHVLGPQRGPLPVLGEVRVVSRLLHSKFQ